MQKNVVLTNLALSVLYLESDVYIGPAKQGLRQRLLRYNSYGSHLVVFVAKSTTLQSDTTRVYFSSYCYLYICAACFGVYLSHPQLCQYKNKLYKEYATSDHAAPLKIKKNHRRILI